MSGAVCRGWCNWGLEKQGQVCVDTCTTWQCNNEITKCSELAPWPTAQTCCLLVLFCVWAWSWTLCHCFLIIVLYDKSLCLIAIIGRFKRKEAGKYNWQHYQCNMGPCPWLKIININLATWLAIRVRGRSKCYLRLRSDACVRGNEYDVKDPLGSLMWVVTSRKKKGWNVVVIQ